jgi:hypothetical protein
LGQTITEDLKDEERGVARTDGLAEIFSTQLKLLQTEEALAYLNTIPPTY